MTLNHLDANCQRSTNPALPGLAFSCRFGTLAPGASTSATFSATASGPDTYIDQISASLGFGAATSVHCNIGLLGVGGQSNIVVSAIARSNAATTNTASIAMQGPDTNPSNNSVGITVKPR
ncbi:MAG: hypothetical protein NVSMB25_12940 [Thermoleophilaceae bacterium]